MQKTWKIKGKIIEAHSQGADLVPWGETLIPCYPHWISPTGGAKFNNPEQKKACSKYWQEIINLKESKILDDMKSLAKKNKNNVYGRNCGKYSGSIYCTLITISNEGELLGRYCKIKPT